MPKNSFKQAAWKHLSNYRENFLDIHKHGAPKRTPHFTYGHILPAELYKLNILPSIREAFWRDHPVGSIKLHDGFHHLSSSQAVCFNLFFPYILYPHAAPALIAALGLTGIPTSGACFEYIPEPAEATNIDFMLPLASGAKILVEMKYTEDGFTTKAPSQKYIDKFAAIYGPRIASRLSPVAHTVEGFLHQYQVARNIFHLGDNPEDAVIFLVPKSNPNFDTLPATVQALVPSDRKPRVRIVYLEDFLPALRSTVTDPQVLKTLEEFAVKYLPTPA